MIDTSWMVLSLYATKNSPQIVSFTDRRYLCLHINRCNCKGLHTFIQYVWFVPVQVVLQVVVQILQ